MPFNVREFIVLGTLNNAFYALRKNTPFITHIKLNANCTGKKAEWKKTCSERERSSLSLIIFYAKKLNENA